MRAALFIPLTSGLLYAMAAMCLKRAGERGTGPWRVTFVANCVQAIVLAPLWLLGGAAFSWSHLAHAVLAGGVFFIGQIFTFLALSRGDVSVVTPVLGMKVILVALFTTLAGAEHLSAVWWVAALLAAAATALLGGGPVREGGHTFACSLGYGLGAATAFALTDVLVQKWVREWGFGHFAPVMFGTVGVLSFTLIPLFREPLRALPASTWRWLGVGGVLLGMQACGVALSITVLGATLTNIFYNSRAVWSVVIVWTIGHWFSNTERAQGGGVMGRRLAGSALLLAAIALVV